MADKADETPPEVEFTGDDTSPDGAPHPAMDEKSPKEIRMMEVEAQAQMLEEGSKAGTLQPERTFTDISYLNRKIAEEQLQWRDHGMHTRMFEIDGFIVETQLKALVGFLIKKGLIDETELQLFYGSMLLEKMKEFRERAKEQYEEQERQRRQAEIMDGVAGVDPNQFRDPRRHIQ